jgi:hypothetical protein
LILLESDGLILRVDEACGGEILDMVELVAGRQLLAHMPFSSVPAVAGDHPEAQWLESHRGGWQLLTPNAGSACRVDGVEHGFHGASSRGAWAIVDRTRQAVTMEWSGHGLIVTRQLRVTGNRLIIECRWDAPAGRVPFIAVEHLAVGPEVLDPSVSIRLGAGSAYELSEADGPIRPADDAPRWPRVGLLDGSEESGDSWSFAADRSRYMVVADLPEGTAEIQNERTGCGLRIEWDRDVLPHAWIWHEVRVSDGPWHRAAQLLMLEPASVPHSLGLAEAIGAGQALWAEPGASVGYTLTATVLA